MQLLSMQISGPIQEYGRRDFARAAGFVSPLRLARKRPPARERDQALPDPAGHEIETLRDEGTVAIQHAAAAPVKPKEDNMSLKDVGTRAAEQAEKELVLRVLEETSWNRKQAARRLNICYKALLNKLKRWQIDNRHSMQSSLNKPPAMPGVSAYAVLIAPQITAGNKRRPQSKSSDCGPSFCPHWLSAR